jgi:hypothetical protein
MGSIRRREDLATAQDVLERVIELWTHNGGTEDLLISTIRRATGSGYSIAERNGGRVVHIVGSLRNSNAQIHAGSPHAFDTLDMPRDTAVTVSFQPNAFDEAAASVVQFFLASGLAVKSARPSGSRIN